MYSVTIIGGGAISSGYDSPSGENILTHIHGALCHPDINLDAVVEVSEKRCQYIIEKWGNGFDVFSNLEDYIIKYKSDIIVVATPTHTHLKIIEDLLFLYTPKLIICEKPIVSSLIEYERLNLLLKKTNTKIITHFPRRFDPSMNILKNKIRSVDEIYHFYGTFTKGLVHNGSHMIDLINMLVGDINNINLITKKIINNEIFGKFLVQTDKTSGVISNINNDKLSLFEFTIYTNRAKYEIIGHEQNIKISCIENSKKFDTYVSYSNEETLSKTLDKYGYNLFDYTIKLIDNDVFYQELKNVQDNVNRFIFLTQNKFLEN